MNIQLGNLKLEDVVEKEYLDTIQAFLDTNEFVHTAKCDDISGVKGNYHIFDIPTLITICDEDKMKEFIAFLQDNDLVGKGFSRRVGVTYVDYKSKS